MHHTVCCQCPVIDHDRSPADKLQHIQDRKQNTSFLSKAHLYSLHCTLSDFSADHSCQEQHQTTNDVSYYDCRQSFSHAKRGQICSGQDLCDRNPCAEPDQTVFK